MDELTQHERAVLAAHLEGVFPHFCQYVFQEVLGEEMAWTPIHDRIWRTLQRVESGEITRLIINVMPRTGKTLFIVVLWTVWHLIKNQRCRFLCLSSGEALVRDTSSLIKDILAHPAVKLLWDVPLKADTTAKDLWRTIAGGAVRCAPIGGQVVGFGAGVLGMLRFAGCAYVDDPVKPDDIRSALKMQTVNSRYNSTVASRVNDVRTPIIVLMQRLGDNDLSEFLLKGGSGEKWHHLRIPDVVIEDDPADERYGTDWLSGIPIRTNIPPGPVWPAKMDEQRAEQLREAVPDVYAAQYNQNPATSVDKFYRTSWFARYTSCQIVSGVVARATSESHGVVDMRWLAIFGDTAMKKGEHNDYSVFQLWGKGVDGRFYLLDQIRGKWEIPDLEVAGEAFLNKHKSKPPNKLFGWRSVYIEDKASGTGLIQKWTRVHGGSVIAIQRSVDKVQRGNEAKLSGLCAGKVVIPASAPWVPAYLAEFDAFNADMTHAHDDQIDPTLDAIEKLGSGSLDWV